MERLSTTLLALGAVLGLSSAAGAGFTPWGALETDSWICFDSPPDPNQMIRMYSANAGSYALGFDQAKNDNSARGMNALSFSYGGADTGHRGTHDQDGNFTVEAGGTKTYSDLLVLVAIDADSLPAEFSLSMGRQGGTPYSFDPNADFGYYDPNTRYAGRPGGYYSVTDPNASPLSYCFDAGMVTIMAMTGLALDGSSPVTIHYEFKNLPGKAVFSLYALVDGKSHIYHTNRGVPDKNDAGSAVSTFEVVPEPNLAVLLACGATALMRRKRKWATCGT